VIGILGGSFDPIHYGHLRTARELVSALELAQLRFVPTSHPPHRAPPIATAVDRLQMLQLAIAPEPKFVVDERELRRDGPSYTLLTLESLRAELGSQPLALVLGMDAFLGLDRWHRWQELWGYAHIVVMPRPGWPSVQGLPAWAQPRLCLDARELTLSPGGRLWVQAVTAQDISSTRIRAALAQGESAADWLPPAILQYIKTNHVYQ